MTVPPTFARNDPRLRFRHVEQFIQGCPDRYFVTLTMNRRFDPMRFSAEVGQTMHRVNAKLFGNHYGRSRDGKKMRLATLATQETTLNGGLHTHMLVGVPEGSLSLKTNPCPVAVPDLIIQTWIEGDPKYRRRDGQDACDLYDFSGGQGYIYKGVRSLLDLDNVDVLNTIIP